MSEQVEVKYKIGCEQLLWINDALIDELISFLEEKLGNNVVITRENKFILLGISKDQELSKRSIKVYIKRFLHKFELLDRLRVITGPGDSYIIHKRKGIEVTRF